MIAKLVLAFGEPTVVACDGNCLMAYGIQNRPKVQLSENPDDYAFLSDLEVRIAPEDPGTYEGGHGKPGYENRLNKWCFRECERSVSSSDIGKLVEIHDWKTRRYNLRNRLIPTVRETPK